MLPKKEIFPWAPGRAFTDYWSLVTDHDIPLGAWPSPLQRTGPGKVSLPEI